MVLMKMKMKITNIMVGGMNESDDDMLIKEKMIIMMIVVVMKLQR